MPFYRRERIQVRGARSVESPLRVEAEPLAAGRNSAGGGDAVWRRLYASGSPPPPSNLFPRDDSKRARCVHSAGAVQRVEDGPESGVIEGGGADFRLEAVVDDVQQVAESGTLRRAQGVQPVLDVEKDVADAILAARAREPAENAGQQIAERPGR